MIKILYIGVHSHFEWGAEFWLVKDSYHVDAMFKYPEEDKYFCVYDLFAICKKYYPWAFSKLFGYGEGNENVFRLR